MLTLADHLKAMQTHLAPYPSTTIVERIHEAAAALETAQKALQSTLDHFDLHVEAIYGQGHNIAMAAGATNLRREIVDALQKLKKA